MKKEDIEKAQEGELEKVTGFHYVKGSICRLDREESPEEIREGIQDDLKKELCPRDGANIVGKEFCPGCGGRVSAMLEAVKGKYGI